MTDSKTPSYTTLSLARIIHSMCLKGGKEQRKPKRKLEEKKRIIEAIAGYISNFSNSTVAWDAPSQTMPYLATDLGIYFYFFLVLSSYLLFLFVVTFSLLFYRRYTSRSEQHSIFCEVEEHSQ